MVVVMVFIIIVVFLVLMVNRTDRKTRTNGTYRQDGQTGWTGGTERRNGQTGRIDQIFKLDFTGTLCRAASAILAWFLNHIHYAENNFNTMSSAHSSQTTVGTDAQARCSGSDQRVSTVDLGISNTSVPL